MVTVLFASVPSLPLLSERLEAEEAGRLISACVEALSAPVYKYGGTVDKFVGQELMAVFGAIDVYEDDAARALWAALEMREAMEEFNRVHEAGLPEPLAVRCGVNTGLTFAGEVGAPGLRSFTVVGDAVNLANRLAHLAELEQVFVGESTYRQTVRLFHFRPLPPLAVRGKLEPVSAYILLGAREGYRRAWGISGLSSPLVGRVEERAAMEGRLRRLWAAEGGVFAVVGEAGLGKSRLVAEVRAAAQELRWLEGRCLSFQSGYPYYPFRDLILRHLDLGEATPMDESCGRLQEMAARFVPGKEPQVYPFLAYLLGLPPDQEGTAVLDPLSGEGLQRSFFRAMRMLLKGMARDQPTVVVMEDFHWADESSLALLLSLMPLTLEVPLLFLTVMRPGPRGGPLQSVREAAIDVGTYSEVRLEPLSYEESATLIANLLQTDRLPTALQRRLLAKAEGNPLFVEEIVRALMQDGALVERMGRWEVTRDIAAIHIPDSLRGLLVSRVDRLEPDARKTLQRAAVIGRVFSERVLRAISDDDEALTNHLRLLLDCNLVRYYRLEGEQGRAFIFNHVLTHEATYRGILLDERRGLHRRVLEEMERLYAGRLEPHHATLARHAYLGEVWDKAVRYLHLAGDRAKVVYALPEAVRYYQRAMGIVQEHGVTLDREQLADLYHECCSAQSLLGDYTAARMVCNVLMEMGERLDDPYLRGHALHGAAIITAHTGDTVAQVASARAACGELEAAGDDWGRGTALFLLALGLFRSGRLSEASAAIEEGLRLVGATRRWPGYDPQGEALYYAGLISLVRGELAEAARLLAEGEERARRTGELFFVGVGLGFTGLACGFQGEYVLGMQKAEEGVRVAEGGELPMAAYLSAACAAWVYAMAGRYGAAIRRAAPAAAGEVISLDTRAIAHVALGKAHLGFLEVEAGLRHYQQALEVAGLTHTVTATALRGIGLAYVLLGRTEQGLNSLHNSLVVTMNYGLKWFHAEALRDMARAYAFLGDKGAALEHAEKLLDIAEPAGYRELVGWGHLLRGLASGDADEARRALRVAHYLGCLPLQWEAGETLACIAGDEEGRLAARAAVRSIADYLSGERRQAFLGRERIRSLID